MPLLKVFPKITRSLFLLLSLLTLLGCVIPASGGGKMQVEVDVFSGRPNPEWTLAPQEANEFVRLFRALPRYSGEASVKEGLGYRGLRITKPGETIEGYSEIEISNGLVVARQNSQFNQFADRDRSLERWAFQTGKGRLDETLYQQISKQMN
ncbi:hypothetical protein H6F89_11055 [Cyanobacteria bacterium FACHB-63]|nr:hypothetical protein [Cyanobacteria bacterium FACHB-63]